MFKFLHPCFLHFFFSSSLSLLHLFFFWWLFVIFSFLFFWSFLNWLLLLLLLNYFLDFLFWNTNNIVFILSSLKRFIKVFRNYSNSFQIIFYLCWVYILHVQIKWNPYYNANNTFWWSHKIFLSNILLLIIFL